MKFEYAIEYLRNGDKIYRILAPDKGYLQAGPSGSTDFIRGSFYMTIYDILADDWSTLILKEEQEYHCGNEECEECRYPKTEE